MPCQRRLHGDLRGLGVADFADHDLVRVVAQYGAQSPRKAQPLALVHGDLQHAGHLVLDRVLDRDDLARAVVDLGDRRVQRRGLAAAGRTGHEQHAVRFARELADHGHRARVKAQVVQRETRELVAQVLLVQDADHGVLAEDAGHDGDAEIDVAVPDARLETAVLRRAPLRDVELGHDLDARDRLFVELGAGHAPGLGQHAVDAVAHDQPAGSGLEVDVGGAGAHGVEQRRVDETDHRAGGLVDARQRNFFHAGAPWPFGKTMVEDARQCRGCCLQARQHRKQLRLEHQFPRGRGDAPGVGPTLQGLVGGVDEQQDLGVAARHHQRRQAAAVGQTQQVEIGNDFSSGVKPAQGVMERAPELRQQLVGRDADLRGQDRVERAGVLARAARRVADQGHVNHCGDCGALAAARRCACFEYKGGRLG